MPSRRDRVQLIVNGTTYRDWYDVDMDSNLFEQADAWQLQAKVPERPFVGAFREGMNADLYIGEDRAMAGLVDDVKFGFKAERRTLTLVGRDKGAWLIDCEAEPLKVAKYTLKTLAEKLMQPQFGIRNVIVSNEDARKKSLGKKDRGSRAGTSRRGASLFGDSPREKTKLDPGTKIAKILDDHCARLGIAWWITPAGDLFLGKPNYEQEQAYEFRLYARGSSRANVENNVLSCEVVRSLDGRCDKLTVAGQGAGGGTIFSSSKSAKGAKFVKMATDPDLVNRGIKRSMYIADPDALSGDMTQKRADEEMGTRRLKALQITLEVAGFRQGQGERLYQPDTLASVKIEDANIDGVFYVTQRRFLESRKKSRTQLTLHEKGVWLA